MGVEVAHPTSVGAVTLTHPALEERESFVPGVGVNRTFFETQVDPAGTLVTSSLPGPPAMACDPSLGYCGVTIQSLSGAVPVGLGANLGEP